MHDTLTSPPQDPGVGARWLLLIHQLPPKPDYLRVKVRRRLKAIGAVAVKRTVYLLPNSPESLEDFQWLRSEIEAAGGSAMIAEAAFVAGLSDEEVDAMLAREQAYASNAEPARAATAERVAPGQTWVTRAGVHIDRMACAWLIRRFIDPQARFKFVPARGYVPIPGELRFDMFEAEYTHEGEECSFQTLARRFAITEAAVRAIGEIVHDIDCKDERYGRAETEGIASLVRGIADAHDDDAVRITRGSALLDDLHVSFRKRRP